MLGAWLTGQKARFQYQKVAGPEGLEPSTNCFAGSHSVQAELWAQQKKSPGHLN